LDVGRLDVSETVQDRNSYNRTLIGTHTCNFAVCAVNLTQE